MSIIYEALQKTQNQRRNLPEEPQRHTPPERSVKLTAIPAKFLLASLMAGILAFGAAAVYRFENAPFMAPPLPAYIPLQPPENYRPEPIRPVMTESAVADLALNGVVISNDQTQDKIAVINNHTYHIGEEVEGMILVDITERSVRLKQGEQEIMLKLK